VDIQISSADSGSLTVLRALLASRLKRMCIALMLATVEKFVDTHQLFASIYQLKKNPWYCSILAGTQGS
jgi:hypothetical protein